MKVWKPNTASSQILLAVQRILNSYAYPITFKQLYYLLVSEGVIDNSTSRYRMLNNLITNARKYGRLRPSLFVPSNPKEVKNDGPDEYLKQCINLYHLDRTSTQKNYVEVWVERNTIQPFVSLALAKFDIPVYVCQSQSNYSFVYQAYQRLEQAMSDGKVPRILCLNDLGVSSFNALDYFTAEMASLTDVSYEDMSKVLFSVCVLPEHIIKYDLKSAPNTTNDKRTRLYENTYGELLQAIGLSSTVRFEVEAIEPNELMKIIYNAVFSIVDKSLMDEVAKLEYLQKDALNEKLRHLLP